MSNLLARLLWVVFVGCVWAPQTANANDNRPLTVVIEDTGGGEFEITRKVPLSVNAQIMPALVSPQSCETSGEERRWTDAFGHWSRVRWRCKDGLAGAFITIDYPGANPNIATIGRFISQSGKEKVLLLPPHETSIFIPPEKESGNPVVDFAILGIEHIWMGIDHLLFVAGLIFVASTRRALYSTITGFTLAHSLTLALSALDLVRLPIRAVESAIALSIVFLAVEIAKGPRATLTWRHPIAVSGSFGLLHGFGFAAVLREVGLPENGLLAALFAFNFGIEIGQVIFALSIIATLALLRRLLAGNKAVSLMPKFVSYFLGVTASYWLISRAIY